MAVVVVVPGEFDVRRTLVVGDVDSFWDEDFLASLFRHPVTELEVVTQIVIARHKDSGKSAGVAAVEFATRSDASAVLRLNNAPIPDTGRNYRLRWADTSDGGYMGVEPSQHSCVLCVSGLGGVVDSQALRDAAESMRSLEKLSTSITSATVMRGSAGALRDYGYIFLEDPDEAVQIGNKLRKKGVAGRSVQTRMHVGPSLLSYTAAAAAASVTSMASMTSTAGGSGMTAAERARKALQDAIARGTSSLGAASSAVAERAQAAASGMVTKSAASTVFVRGVDISNATEITLRRLFSSCGEVVHVKIVAARACAFVMYGDKAAAAKAVSSLDGRLVGNSKIRVAVRVPVKRQSHAPAPKAHAGSGGGAAAIKDDEDVVDMDTDSPSGGEAPMEGISGLGDESAAAILRRSRYFFPSYRYPENNGIDGGGVY